MKKEKGKNWTKKFKLKNAKTERDLASINRLPYCTILALFFTRLGTVKLNLVILKLLFETCDVSKWNKMAHDLTQWAIKNASMHGMWFENFPTLGTSAKMDMLWITQF